MPAVSPPSRLPLRNPDDDTMTSAQTLPAQVTGTRRITPPMLAALDLADGFVGLPRGTAKPLRLLAAFQRAEPYLGLPHHGFKLVTWLVMLTKPQDWEDGSRPIAWPSAQRQADYLGLSLTQVKALNRSLYESGIFVIRDNADGKRYGRRSGDGRIIEAYGFDLSPLARRCDEFEAIANEARAEQGRIKTLRARVTRARRMIRQFGVEMETRESLPASWPETQAETAVLVAAAGEAERSQDLARIATSLERREIEAERAYRQPLQPVETDPMGSENRPHPIYTNLDENPSETVAAQVSGPKAPAASLPSPQVSGLRPTPGERALADPGASGVHEDPPIRLTPAQLLDLAPRLGHYVISETPSWSTVVDAAGDSLRHELDVSRSLWGHACLSMGREQAAMALAIVSTKAPGYFTRGPGAYFAGMVRKAKQGDLRLGRSFLGLRQQVGTRCTGWRERQHADPIALAETAGVAHGRRR